jgi:hypothetical protein
MTNETPSSVQLLRHTLATIAYRGGKTLRGAPATFAEFRSAETSRSPVQILAHIGDLFDWGLSMAIGQRKWRDSPPLAWDKEVERFFATLKTFDDYLAACLASEKPLHATPEKLFQGPVADALTHIGQIAMLRRMSGSAIKGESYYDADIVVGRVGPEQTPPKREFD